jgi:hypothetical protein
VKTQSVLHGALGALAAHQDLIQEAYERGSLRRTTENARAITVLHQYRLLIADGPDNYHLSRLLSRLLDDVTQRQRLYESLGESIGPLSERIYNLKSEFASAARAGHAEEMDLVAANFHDACNDLSDAVASSLSRLLVQAESRFGVVGSLSAKLRQNEHYLRQAEKISEALSALERSQDIYWDIHDGDPLYEDLTGPYHRIVSQRLGEWSAEILRVTAILKTFLFRLRQVAPDVRRIRDLSDFLHHNPGYEPPDFSEQGVLPTWLHRDPGVRLRAHPDVRDESIGPELEAIARKLPAARVVVPRKREAGSLTRSAGDKPKVKLAPQPQKIQLIRFVTKALESPVPLSARKWNRSEGSSLNITDDLWLFLVMQARQSQVAPFNKVIFRSIEYRGAAPISKNVFVRDILVHGR